MATTINFVSYIFDCMYINFNLEFSSLGDVRSYKNGHDVQDPSQLHSDKGKLDQTHCSISEENNESIINV